MSMYLEYYGLQCEPFTIAPDPAFLYPSQCHRQALAHLKYGLDREGGFILLTGEVGTGKTTLTRLLLDQVPANVRVAYILNARLGAEDVLASICHELGIDVPAQTLGSPVKLAIDALNQDLLAHHARGKKTLVVIEEAQNLSPDVLEVLRLLTNLETNTRKLLHILLVGQPELLDLIGQKQLRQLNQRVVSRYHLPPLGRADLANYLQHRLQRAGARTQLFDRGSIAALYRISGGIPRIVNLVAQHALIAGYALGLPQIRASILRKAAAEILGTDSGAGRKASRKPMVGWAVASLLLAGGVVLALAGNAVTEGAGWLFDRALPDTESAAVREPVQAGFSTAALAGAMAGAAPMALPGSGANPELPPAKRTDDSSDSSLPVSASAANLTAAPMPAMAGPFAALLQRWGVGEQSAASETEVCAIAAGEGLRCGQVQAGDLAAIEAVNRVGIAWLASGAASLRAYLLVAINAGQISLVSGSESLRLSSDQFLQRWSGDFLYLWSPPPGFERDMTIGAVNGPIIDWLQQRLQMVGTDNEALITGGRYTVAIRDQVLRFQQANRLAADGVLGPRTILKLNERAGLPVPQLAPLAEGG